MDIKYLGHSSFFIKSKEAKLVTDPFDPQMVGLKFPKVEADIVTVSHQHKDHNQAQLVVGTPLIIDMPGEFEKKSIRILGFQTFHDKQKGAERGENIAYKIEGEGISLLHCGDLGLVWDDSFIDQIGEINVLLIPVGGVYTIDVTQAVTIVKDVEPSIVIPMHYLVPGLQRELDPVTKFLKEMGLDEAAAQPKLTITPASLPPASSETAPTTAVSW